MAVTDGGLNRREHGCNWWVRSRNQCPHRSPCVIILVWKAGKETCRSFAFSVVILMNIGGGYVLCAILVKVYYRIACIVYLLFLYGCNTFRHLRYPHYYYIIFLCWTGKIHNCHIGFHIEIILLNHSKVKFLKDC